MSDYYILDTETASLSGGVCEIAWLRIDEKLDIKDQFVSRVNPQRPIEPGAFAIHGISDADVADCPTMEDISAHLPEPITIIGHNVNFDIRMISPYIQAKASLCTLSLSRQYVKGTTNHKLPTLQSELGLPDRESHSALGDVLTVRDVLLHILPLSGRTLQGLITVNDKPKILHRMPFGKHRGLLMSAVPAGYRSWLLDQSDLDKDLRYTLEKMKGIL